MNNIQRLKDLYGEEKSFSKVAKTTHGREYEWDSDFIKTFNDFLKGEELYNKSKSDRNRIEKFIAFANNEMSEDDEDYEVMKKFNDYLGGLL